MRSRSRLRAALTRTSASLLHAVAIAVVALGDVEPVVAADPEPAASAQQLSDAELDELVAPIALYPDELLAITLPASTFPLQIVQAARFLDKRDAEPDLQPDEDWDESVLGLLNYPEVVEMMNEDLDWTWKLGEAVVDHQPAVMDAVQRFRAEVDAAGNLESNDKMLVEKKSEGSKQIIVIQSASPEVIYVPTYQPSVVVVHQPVPYAYHYSHPYPYYYNPAALFWTGMFVGAAVGYGMSWGYGHHHSSVKINHNYNYNVNVNRPGGGGNWGGGENWKPPKDRPHGGRPGRQPGQRPRATPATRPATGGPTRPGGAPRQTASATPRDRGAAQPRGRAKTRPAPNGREYTRQPAARGSSLGSYERGSAARAQGARGASSRRAASMGGGRSGRMGRGGGTRGGGGGRRR